MITRRPAACLLALLLPATAAAAPQTLNPANGHYYLFVPGQVTLEAARAGAEAMEFQGRIGHLATIEDSAENAFVRSLGSGTIWIGATQDLHATAYAEPGSGWSWMTGEPFSYTNWAFGEPNNGGASEPIEEVIQMYNSGLWNDVFGTVPDTLGYVVEFDEESTPAQNPTNGHFYRTIDVALSWEEARKAASALSFRGLAGHLATVTSESERAFITSIYPPGTNRWLGGYQDTLSLDYAEPAGGWRWVTGEPMNYENWQSGEPNNGGFPSAIEEYLHSYSSGRWNDTFIDAGDILGYVVEFDGALGNVACSSNPNSTGAVGTIQADGSRDVQDNNVALTATSLPLGAFGFFITSDTPGAIALPGLSEGILCLGGGIGRYVGPGQIQSSGAIGAFGLQIDLGSVPTPVGPVTVSPGETRYFQAWFRDSIGGNATSNFTNGMSISFR